MTAILIGAPAPLTDLFTHITVDPRLSVLEYGLAPAGITTTTPDTGPAPEPGPAPPAVNPITVDPRSQALLFGPAPAGIVTVPPVVDIAPSTPSPPVVVASPISADPRFGASHYAAPSPWASLFALYHRA